MPGAAVSQVSERNALESVLGDDEDHHADVPRVIRISHCGRNGFQKAMLPEDSINEVHPTIFRTVEYTVFDFPPYLRTGRK